MKKLFLILLAFSSNSFAFKQIDYACVADCSKGGYQYNFCQAQCTYENGINNSYNSNNNRNLEFSAPSMPPIKQTDYKCVTDCTNKGYLYNYCSSACSY